MIIINYGILSFGWLSIIELPSEWIEYKKSIAPSVYGRHGVAYESDRSRHPVYKQTVLKTGEPKGLWVRILPLAYGIVA